MANQRRGHLQPVTGTLIKSDGKVPLYNNNGLQPIAEAFKRDKPSLTTIGIINFANTCLLQYELTRKYGLKFESWYVLMVIVKTWEITGKGIGSFGISRLLNEDEKRIRRSTYLKIKILLERGLIEVCGNGHYDCMLYAPAKRLLNELNSVK